MNMTAILALMNITDDIAAVLAGLITLDDILAARLVCAHFAAIFRIPPLLTFADLSGNIICARRHNYVIHNAATCISHIPRIFVGGFVFSTEQVVVPTAVPVRGFPLIVISTYAVNEVLRMMKMVFGRCAIGLPIYYSSGDLVNFTGDRTLVHGLPLHDYKLVSLAGGYGTYVFEFVTGDVDSNIKHYTTPP